MAVQVINELILGVDKLLFVVMLLKKMSRMAAFLVAEASLRRDLREKRLRWQAALVLRYVNIKERCIKKKENVL